MKFAVFAILASSASAFTPTPLTFAVGKKAPAKVAAKTVAVAPKKVAPVKKVVVAAKPAATKAIAKPLPKPVAKPAPKVVAKVTPKVVAKVAPKVVAKPAPKVVAKVAPKVVAKVAPVKPAPKPVVKKVAPPPKKIVVKPVAKVAPKPIQKIVIKKRSSVGTVPSQALPYDVAPALLDGSLVGDVGFDPCYLSTKADSMVPYFNGIVAGRGPVDGLTWYREAELMHGRISMIAVVGFIAPGFGTFAGNEWTDSFGYTNPLEAIGGAPSASLFQIFAFMSILEFRRISIIQADGTSYQAGASQKWGQGGSDFWNPLGLNYTPAEYAEKQLQEIKHARLAMIGLLGLIFQAQASGVGVVDQLSAAFVTPGYVAKAGYFLPEGI